MAAMLSSVMDSDKIAVYVDLTKKMGIKILPPDVNYSGVYFEVENGAIRYALSAIKNLGEGAISGVVKVRERGGKFKSLLDFCSRINLKDFNRKTLENLIKCGAFDSIDSRRTALFEAVELAMNAGTQKNREISQGQGGLFGEEIISKAEKILPDVAEKSRAEILAWEKEAFGFYMSGNPLDDFAEKFSGFIKIDEIKRGNFQNNQIVRIGGLIVEARQITTKRGDLMANITLEDFSDKIGVTVFPLAFSKYTNLILADNIVIVTGKVDTSGDSIKILANEIFSAQDYTPDIYFTVEKNLQEKVLDILKKNNGESAAYFKIDGKWRKQNFKVAITENLREELKNLIGTENFRVY